MIPDVRGNQSPVEIIGRMRGRGVFLFAFTRSGTTLFTHFLSTHPEMQDFGEVLNEQHSRSFFRDFARRSLLRIPPSPAAMTPTAMERAFYGFLERTLKRARGKYGVFDLKLQCLHTIDGNWRLPGKLHFKLFDVLREGAAPVILLERRDLVARHLSMQMARRRGVFHSFSDSSAARAVDPLAIDLDALQEEITLIRSQHAAVRAAFAGHDRFLALNYEDLLASDDDGGAERMSPEIAQTLADFLDIENAFDLAAPTRRMAPGDYGRFITNLAEVEALRTRLVSCEMAT